MRPTTKRPLRVLVVGPSMANFGGQSVQAELIRRGLADEPSLEVSFQPIDPPFPRGLASLRRLRFVRTAINETLYVAQLRTAIARSDVVHAFAASYLSFALAPTPAILMARRMGRGVILNYHSGEAEDHLARWHSAVRTLRLTDAIVVPSQYLVDVLGRHGLAASVVFNAVDLSAFRFRARPDPAPTFLVNRNFEAHYNVACVLRAFGRIQAKRPEATLTVAGDGPEGASLRALAASLALRNVRFAGRVRPEDMPALYGAHDFWLNGSDVDNMPVSILEAFASGVAVVSTRPGGIPYLVDDGRTGRLVPCGDSQALAAAALGILDDPALFARLTRAGREECVRYTWPRVRQGWLDAYSRLAPEGTMLHRPET